MHTIVVAPHPDDETLGAGGTLLRRKAQGWRVAWVIVTAVSSESGWSAEKVQQRNEEIQRVSEIYGFDAVYSLGFQTTRLDMVPICNLIEALSGAFREFSPEEVFIPHAGDVHTDHKIVSNAVAACTKWFRYPSVKRVLAYETLSETDFSLCTTGRFYPNVYVDIGPFLEGKLRAMDVYSSELGTFPFPRSHASIKALASLRGAASGFAAAEAFELLLERL